LIVTALAFMCSLLLSSYFFMSSFLTGVTILFFHPVDHYSFVPVEN
jgi:hypothetical protein